MLGRKVTSQRGLRSELKCVMREKYLEHEARGGSRDEET